MHRRSRRRLLGLAGLLALLHGVAGGVLAQAAAEVALILDRPLYALGDRVRAAVLCAPEVLPEGAVVEVLLVGPGGSVVSRHFASAKTAGVAATTVDLAYALEAGVYRLLVEGLPEGGRVPVALARALLPVYDDLDEASWPEADGGTEEAFLAAARSAGALMSPDPAPLTLRPPERVRGRGRVEMANVRGGAVLRVGDDLLAPPGWPTCYVTRDVPGEPLGSDAWVSGRLTDARTGDAVSANLLAAVPRSGGTPYYTKSDADGRFLLRVPPGESAGTLQFAEPGLPARRVTRDVPASRSAGLGLPGSARLDEILRASARRRAIYGAFGRDGLVSASPPTPPARVSPRADLAYAVGDYKAFGDFATFAFEVFGTASRWRPRRGGYYVRVYNRRNKEYFGEEPLVLVDGYIARDLAAVSALPMTALDSVFIYGDAGRLRRLYPGIGQNGVIRITTRDGADVTPFRDAASTLPVAGLRGLPVAPRADASLPLLSPTIAFAVASPDAAGASGASTAVFTHTDDRSRFTAQCYTVGDGGRVEVSAGGYAVE